jgi:hypothetical protein
MPTNSFKLKASQTYRHTVEFSRNRHTVFGVSYAPERCFSFGDP